MEPIPRRRHEREFFSIHFLRYFVFSEFIKTGVSYLHVSDSCQALADSLYREKFSFEEDYILLSYLDKNR